jgi:hypothetical protein
MFLKDEIMQKGEIRSGKVNGLNLERHETHENGRTKRTLINTDLH